MPRRQPGGLLADFRRTDTRAGRRRAERRLCLRGLLLLPGGGRLSLLGRTASEVPPGLRDTTVAVPLQRPSTPVEPPVLCDQPPADPYSLADLPLFHGLPPSVVSALEAAAKDVELDAR